jgi:protein TonB
MAPKEIPKQVAIIKEDDLPPPMANAGVIGGVPGGVPGGAPGGVLGGIIGSVGAAAPPPPTVKEAPKPATPQRIRVGGNVQQANLIKRITPQYPPLAKQARIQGVVKFTAIIGKDGTIQNLQLVSGHPLLVPAATDAVKQWVYKPTLLNNEPVEVITQIDVNFTLSQ